MFLIVFYQKGVVFVIYQFFLSVFMSEIPFMCKRQIHNCGNEAQAYCHDDVQLGYGIKDRKTIAQGQTYGQPKFPRKEESALRGAALTMATHLDEI